MPLSSTILMVRPVTFGFNEETAANNFFQNRVSEIQKVLQQAMDEFENMVSLLRRHDIEIIVFEDGSGRPKPDAVFPNNWLGTSPAGIVSVFPMYAENRRTEKRDDILKWLNENFKVKDVQDWSEFEAEGRFLEGTGSMVMDHDNKMIYAAISPRTNLFVLEKYAAANGYQAMVFLATDKEDNPVYHTNVMMMLGENFSVVCEESVEEEWELIALRQLLESTGHKIIPIDRKQMLSFAGNMLELINKKGEKILVMSRAAFDSLYEEQKQILDSYARLLPIPIPTIEAVGGGSVRCMMTEIFLERK